MKILKNRQFKKGDLVVYAEEPLEDITIFQVESTDASVFNDCGYSPGLLIRAVYNTKDYEDEIIEIERKYVNKVKLDDLDKVKML